MATNARPAAHSLFIAARRKAMKALNKVKQIHISFSFICQNSQDLFWPYHFKVLYSGFE